RHRLWNFDTSSAVCLRSPLRTLPDGMLSRLLLQRSPSLLTIAACSGLRPAPDCRPRGAYPHLSYSFTSPSLGCVRDTPILFHLLVPGGRWLTTMSMPRSLASFWSSRFRSRTPRAFAAPSVGGGR